MGRTSEVGAAAIVTTGNVFTVSITGEEVTEPHAAIVATARYRLPFKDSVADVIVSVAPVCPAMFE